MASGKRETLQRATEALIEVGRPLMLRGAPRPNGEVYAWEPRSCIGATRIAVDVYRALGLRARPLSVKLHVFNPAWTRLAEDGRRLADEGGPEAFMEAGAYHVEVGHHPDERLPEVEANPYQNGKLGWNGHLIAIIEERAFLDLSLDSATRPDHDIELRPTAGEPAAETFRPFLAGTEELEGRLAGCALAYEPYPADRTFLTSPDWSAKDKRWEPVVQRVLAACRR